MRPGPKRYFIITPIRHTVSRNASTTGFTAAISRGAVIRCGLGEEGLSGGGCGTQAIVRISRGAVIRCGLGEAELSGG